MKKLTLALICLTLVLSACGTETREPEETDLLETTAAVTSVTVVNTYVDTEVSEEKLSEIAEMLDDDTVYPWLDLTEFAEESYRAIGVVPAGSDIIIVTYESNKKYDVEDRYNSTEYADYISCIDITDKKELYRIDAPMNTGHFSFYEYFKNGKKSVCAVLRIIGEDMADKSSSLYEFAPDGEYTVTENRTYKDIVHTWGERAVSDVDGDIIDVSDGSIIFEHIEEEPEPGHYFMYHYRFEAPLDENRFICQLDGDSDNSGLWIYDFSSEEKIKIPDSKFQCVLGLADGKIISADDPRENIQNIYSSTSDTYENTLFIPAPELEKNEDMNWDMPENREYISFYRDKYVDRGASYAFVQPSGLTLFSTDRGEAIKEFSFEGDYKSCIGPYFTDSCILFFDYETKIISAVKRP